MISQNQVIVTPSNHAAHKGPLATAAIDAPRPLSAYQVMIRDIRSRFSSSVYVNIWATDKKGRWYLDPGEFAYWSRTIEAGKSYLVGDSWSMCRFLKSYSSPLSRWQRMAYDFAIQNPKIVLHVETYRHEWRVYLRGEYVEFRLPSQEKGGEKSYVTRTGKTKVQVDDD